MTEHTFTSWDGTEVFYRAWLPATAAKRAMILFHRGHEHSGRWEETVAALGLDDFAAFAWDQRGHGKSPGERGYARDLADVIKDAEAFARHITATYGIAMEDTALLAHSVGAVIATAWVHDYAPPVRCMILAVPAFAVKLYVPLAVPALRLKSKTIGPGFVKSYVKATMLTHDEEQAAAYKADPLIFRQIAVNVLLDLHDTSKRLIADAGAITTPTLILAAGNDWVVKLGAQRKFFERLGSAVKQMEVYPGFYHAIFHEKGREQVIERTREFVRDCFERPAINGELVESDKGGSTRTEYDLLRGPGGLKWTMARAFLRTMGKLSRGVRLGWSNGFDSGLTLDYVYENRARGALGLGKLIDWFYLNSIGWRGIRVRREHLRGVLQRCMKDLHAKGRPVRVLDIASGPGRYVLETLGAMSGIPSGAVLRDYKEENLDAARAIAAKLGLSNVRIEHGDAFDRASLAAVEPRPTIAIVSGLYELFPENEGVSRSLAGIADAMEEGGSLIYTCQPWHPQMEFIARVLTNREGQPWVMRRRAQAEMDALVRAAGFEKVSQEIDRWGIFTVSAARRVCGAGVSPAFTSQATA